jgi:DNA-binding MarR family transcriptional regulator
MSPSRSRPTADIEPLAVLETELAMLARTLEALRRRSELHKHLDRAGYVLLRTLADGGVASISGVAAALGLDATTVTRQVAALEADGLVRRRRDGLDARVCRVEITALGRRRMESVQAARRERVGALVADWSATDVDRLGSLLGRLNVAIRDFRPDAHGPASRGARGAE